MKFASNGTSIVWQKEQAPTFRHMAGFLPDGDRFVTIGETVSICRFDTGDEEANARYPTYNAHQPQLSPDGKTLGVIGYSCMYLYDMETLGKPRRIGGGGPSFGNFASFAFHPTNRTIAVIHGGPTLIKVYDLDSLKLMHTFKWKLGPLGAVAFSPDGLIGAAGGRDGRIVVWDVD